MLSKGDSKIKKTETYVAVSHFQRLQRRLLSDIWGTAARYGQSIVRFSNQCIIIEASDGNIRLVDLIFTLAYPLPRTEWTYLHQNQQQESHIP